MAVKPILSIASELFKTPPTIQFPERREQRLDTYKGLHRLDMATCISCAACERICPNKTIEMVGTPTDKGMKKMPQINWERCLFCALCEEVCPTACLTLSKETDFAAYDRRELLKRPEEL